MILKSSYPIQLLILALGENSFALPRKLESFGELHSLKKKKTSPMKIMTLLAVLLVGGGGRGEGEGGPNSLSPVPCIPNAFSAIKLYSDNYTLL